RLPHILPAYLHASLDRQKRSILESLQTLPHVEVEDAAVDEDGPSTTQIAYEQLSDLLKGTALRGEGNSCLVIGPRGSGKTRLAISSLPDMPIVICLSGYAQHNDRLAIREIARQLASQTGNSLLPADAEKDADEDPENPFIDTADTTITLPPPAHLLALISVIPTLSRPTVIIIDAFDLFATHARQSLLYCLLDTVQSCRASKANKGVAVIGVTTRVDTINLLEKRVKSRFSGRMLRTACPSRVSYWMALAQAVLCAPVEIDVNGQWPSLWAQCVHTFLSDETVIRIFEETFALTRDVHILRRILVNSVLELTPATPHLSPSKLAASVAIQRCPSRFPFLSSLPYPAICLLIASVHAPTSGHDTFTFEMLHECFRDHVRTSQSAPVQVEGGGIGMAFERLVSLRVLIAVSAPSAGTAKQFVMYRSALDRVDVKRAVETMGQTNLKKWFSKAQ
ncbi:origin recognition complex subunit 4 C-terminus-domain-containing protein, partial [Sparassis latifolia]